MPCSTMDLVAFAVVTMVVDDTVIAVDVMFSADVTAAVVVRFQLQSRTLNGDNTAIVGFST